jgi:tRNA pseudouridine38-40 synthase
VTRNFKLVVEFDGSGFEGWQVQPSGHRTVQGEIEAAIARVCGERVRIMGSGRTDAGVHAEGQVASVKLETALRPDRLQRALNGVLPRDVAICGLEVVPDGFDARRDCVGKLYRYRVWNGDRRSPLREPRWLCLERPLDLHALRKASSHVVGSHDFASFQAAGSSVQTSLRTLRTLDVFGEPGGPIVLDFEGSGFLRHMVRILVGTLLQVASGRRAPDDLAAILAARDRSRAGPTAPAHALTLVRVQYPGDDPLRELTGLQVLGADAGSQENSQG